MRIAGVLLLIASCAACSKPGSTSTTTSPSGGSSSSGGTTVTCPAKTYSPSAGATGSFGPDDSKDCSGPGDIRGDQYTMTLTGETDVDLTYTVGGFPGVMGVYTENNARIFTDGPGSLVHGKLFLPAGVYKIAVGRTNSNAGTYTLTSPPTTLDSCPVQPPFGFTVVGATITSTITANDCGADSHSDPYLFPLTTGQTVSVSVTVDQFTHVEIAPEATNTPVVAKNIQKNTPTTFAFSAPVAGAYRMFIGYPGAGTGSALPINYTLSLK